MSFLLKELYIKSIYRLWFKEIFSWVSTLHWNKPVSAAAPLSSDTPRKHVPNTKVMSTSGTYRVS